MRCCKTCKHFEPIAAPPDPVSEALLLSTKGWCLCPGIEQPTVVYWDCEHYKLREVE